MDEWLLSMYRVEPKSSYHISQVGLLVNAGSDASWCSILTMDEACEHCLVWTSLEFQDIGRRQHQYGKARDAVNILRAGRTRR
jgi:hypothetical protein